MTTLCPHCKKKLTVDDTMVGRQVQCPACRNTFQVPAAPGAAAPTAPAPAPMPPQQPMAPRPPRQPFLPPGLGFTAVTFGKLMILFGLTVVIFARGCNGIQSRGVGRASAKLSEEKNDFEDRWDDKMRPFLKDRTKMTSLSKEKADEEQRYRQSSSWLKLMRSARDADVSRRILAYWMEWIFVIGSVLLGLGLLVVGFYGKGAERTACLVMLGILTFSIYVAGSAWVTSITNLLKG